MGIGKVSSLAVASLAKVNSLAKLSIAKISSVTASFAAAFADDYSLLFDGVNDYVDLADAASTISGVTGSISFWFKGDSINGGYPFEIRVDANNYIYAYYAYDVMNTTRRCAGGNDSAVAFADGSGDDGNWHHLALTWSESADRLISYNDGSAATTRTSINTSFAGTPSIFTLSKYSHWSGGYMEGNINDVAVWSSALSAGEVAAIYNSGTPTDLSGESGLVGYWKFEENTGTTVADSSDNSNDGTLVNGTAFEAETP